MILAITLSMLGTVVSIAPPTEATATQGGADSNGVRDVTTEDDRDVAPNPHRVLLLTNGSVARDSELGTRVRRAQAELAAGGFEPLMVVVTEADADLGAPRLAELAARYGGGALVVFSSQDSEAELWTVDADVGLTKIAVVVGDSVADDDDDAVLAVRLTEVLAAWLLELPTKPEPAAPEPSPPAQPPPPKGPRWAARVGLHGAGSAQRIGFMLGPTLGSTVTLGRRRRLGLDAEAFSTALLGQTDDPAGSATVGLATLRAAAQWWPLPTARFSPALGAGTGALLAWTRGSATAPFTGRTDVTVVALPTAMADLAIRIAPQLRLRLGVRIGVALPAIRIRGTAGTVEAARPLIDGGAALELVPRRAAR